MSEGAIESVRKSSKESDCGDKLPNVNWEEHVAAFENFTCQGNYFNSCFMYSLESQKPKPERSAEGMLCPRPIACNIQINGRLQSSEVEKAWKVLSSNQVSYKNYRRPGITAPVENHVNQFPSQVSNSSSGIKKAANFQKSGGATYEKLYTHKDLSNSPYESNAGASNSLSPTRNSLMQSSSCSNNVDLPSKLVQPDIRGMQVPCGSFNEGLGTNHTLPTNRSKYDDENSVDVSDDDILENIEVDQIGMEHFQTNGTPEGSISKHTMFPPAGLINNATCTSENTIPLEICENCYHGINLGLCPEATNHLREMKDRLISISNDLLDNVELSPSQIESIRQERLHLNKKIQELEKYLQQSNCGNERWVSNSVTSPSAGIMDHEEARRKNAGGKVLGFFY